MLGFINFNSFYFISDTSTYYLNQVRKAPIRNSGGRFSNPRHPPRAPDVSNTIKITNLYYELSEDDIHELLKRVGQVRTVRLQYDESGRSTGVAYANFEKHSDAVAAVEKFNGKKAAGLTISLKLLDESPLLRNRISFSKNRDNNDSSTQRSKTIEELDAELNAYMSGKDVNDNTTNAESKPEQETKDEEEAEMKDV